MVIDLNCTALFTVSSLYSILQLSFATLISVKKIQNKSLGINVLSAISCCDKRRGLSQLRRDLFHPRVKHLNQGMSCGSVKVGRLKPPPVLTAPVNYSQKWSILVD